MAQARSRYNRAPGPRWLSPAVAFVIAWRVLAVPFPHPAADDPAPARVAMGLLGLWFLTCGLWAQRRTGGRAATMFSLYCLTAALHWGGPIGVGRDRPEAWLLALYMVASSLLGQTLFLHLALAFPRPFRADGRRVPMALLYAPALAGGAALIPMLLLDPPSILASLPVLSLAGSLAGIAGGIVWVVRLFRSPSGSRPVGIVAALFAGTLAPPITGLAEPALSSWMNLALAALPVAIAAALSRQCRAAMDGEPASEGKA